jgi:hypothetical protein
MKCPRCHKEISKSGFVYCPHCGKQLEPSKKKGISLRKGSLLAFMLWVGLSALAFGVDALDGKGAWWGRYETFTWAPYVILVLFFLIPYIFGVWAIYSVAKRHNRNAVRWTTVAIVFSPVLAWAAYGLTSRKS